MARPPQPIGTHGGSEPTAPRPVGDLHAFRDVDNITVRLRSTVGVSHRSLLYWVTKGWIKPTWRSPSGRYMWSVEHLESQLAAMEEPPPEEQ